MADRTVTVRLKADIGDFVTDIGVKAPAAVKKLEVAASKANYRLKQTTAQVGDSVDQIGSKADAATTKIDRFGAHAQAATSKTSTAASKASKDLDGVAASTDKASTSTETFSKNTAAATKNADKHADALGKLRVAQLRLTEVRGKSTVNASELAGAEEAVATAERNVKRYEKAGNDSGRAFGSGLKKWLTGSGADLGKAGGTVFGSGFIGALKTPVIGPAIIAVLTGIVLTVMPAIGAVAAGALVTAFGGGLAGLGIVFAAQSAKVSQKWTNTLGQLGSDMKLLATPFQGTLINIADIFQRTVDKFNPALSKAFADTAGPVEGFVARFGGSLEKLIPAIDPIVRAFTASLDALGPAFDETFSALATSLTEVSAAVEKDPEALADFVRGLSGLLTIGLDLIRVLTDTNTQFTTLTSGTSLVDASFAALNYTIGPLIGLFYALDKGLELVNVALGKTNQDVDGAGKSMSDAANNTVLLAQGLGATGAAAQHGAPPMRTLAERVKQAAKDAADAKKRFEDFISTLFRLQNLALNLSGAQIALQAAIDAASKSVKENGKTLDINTEKGRNNKQSLDDVARSANAQTEAMIRGGKGLGAAAIAAQSSRASFIRLAIQMGKTRPEAEALADTMLSIPNVTRTAKLNANIADLESKLATAKNKLKDKTLTATQRAKLEANIKNLEAGIATAKAALASVPDSKTVNIKVNTYKNQLETVTYKTVGVKAPQADGGYWPKGIPSYADGKLPSQATVQPGKGAGLVQWAEQETGGEAFIPLAPSKRDRSTKILGQVANEFGMGLVKSYANGGFTLPGGRLVDIAFLLRQLGISFNPTAGINYNATLTAANKANRAAAPAKSAAAEAARAEQSAKGQVAAIQRAITLQQRAITAARAGKPGTKAGQAAEDRRVAAEQAKLIKLQDQLYGAKKRLTVATAASNKADAVYKIRADAAAKATEAHKASIEQLIEQQKAAVEFADQISQSLTSGANIGDLFQQSLTGKGLLSDLQGKGTDLKKFGTLITQLRAKKLDEALIQQIIGKGADQGGELAQAILDGGLGLVAALNKAQKNLDAQADLIGAGSAAVKFDSKVAGARAAGGDVTAGKTYAVNELGQEYFVAPVNGHITPAGVDPNRYIRSGGYAGQANARVVREVHNHQHITFNGTSADEADLIAQRANARFELMNRGY